MLTATVQLTIKEIQLLNAVMRMVNLQAAGERANVDPMETFILDKLDAAAAAFGY
jgi:hypothetical protein